MSDCSTSPDAVWSTNIGFTRTHFHIRRSGGGGVLPRLLSFVTHAMAVAQLTNLHISIPASGAGVGGGARGVLSAGRALPGDDGPPACILRQWGHGPG